MIFKPYMHVEKLGKDETEGLLNGRVYVFPKLDGTNGSVWLNDAKEVCCGSRNRELKADGEDNYGFFKWVQQNRDKFASLFEKHNWRLYGEFLVPHTLKTYREDAWRNFYIFDVENANGRLLSWEEYKDIVLEAGLSLIPPMGFIENPSQDSSVFDKFLNENKYLIKQDGGLGEGIVLKNHEFRNKYGRTTWAKIVRNEFKEEFNKVQPPSEIKEKMLVERLIAEKYVTRGRIDKILAKIGTSSKGVLIARLLQTVYYEIVKDEMWDAVKSFNIDTISFNRLNKEVVRRIKIVAPEIF